MATYADTLTTSTTEFAGRIADRLGLFHGHEDATEAAQDYIAQATRDHGTPTGGWAFDEYDIAAAARAYEIKRDEQYAAGVCDRCHEIHMTCICP